MKYSSRTSDLFHLLSRVGFLKGRITEVWASFRRKSSKYLGQMSLMGIATTGLLEGVLLGLGTFSISHTHSSHTPDVYCRSWKSLQRFRLPT